MPNQFLFQDKSRYAHLLVNGMAVVDAMAKQQPKDGRINGTNPQIEMFC